MLHCVPKAQNPASMDVGVVGLHILKGLSIVAETARETLSDLDDQENGKVAMECIYILWDVSATGYTPPTAHAHSLIIPPNLVPQYKLLQETPTTSTPRTLSF